MSLTTDQAVALLDKMLAQLGEHFDSVQILTSRRHPQNTATQAITRGVGDWYARRGLAHEFIALDRADEVAQSIAKQLREDEG